MRKFVPSLVFCMILVVGAITSSCKSEKKDENTPAAAAPAVTANGGNEKPNFIVKDALKPGVVALIAGREVTEAELFTPIQNDLYEGTKKIYDMKLDQLRALMMKEFMEKDPRKKGLSDEEFLTKIIAKGQKPSAKDIEKFIKERQIPKEQLNDELRGRIEKFLDVEIKRSAVGKWLRDEAKKNKIEFYVKKPEAPVRSVDIGNAPTRGSDKAKITIVEFSDFQCPYCSRAIETVAQVEKKYGKDLRLAFKHYPLPFHDKAKKAAEASLCANNQSTDKFWKMHDAMFKDQAGIDEAGLTAKAKKIGLDEKKFAECLKSGQFAAQVEADTKQGQELGFDGTPAFLINGQLLVGAQPLEAFVAIIEGGNDLAKEGIIANVAPSPDMAAKINDKMITEAELIKDIRNEIYEEENKIHQMKMEKLKGIVLREFIEKELAKNAGMKVEEYSEKFIMKGQTVSPEDIQKFIKENQIPEQEITDQLKDRIKTHLLTQVKKRSENIWMAEQTKSSPVEIYFKAPQRPTFQVDVGTSPTKGPEGAKVTIVEFSDFQCPYCSKGAETVRELEKKYGDKIRIAFKSFPLSFHENAKKASEAALCAKDQKPESSENFWKMHDAMFADQSKLNEEGLLASAQKLGLDTTKLKECLTTGKFSSAVEADIKQGEGLSLRATPTFFINGQLVSGALSIESFSEIIDPLL